VLIEPAANGGYSKSNLASRQAGLGRRRVYTKSISQGYSASFPATGLAAAGYHAPGTEIVGASMNHNEVTINTDGIWYASAFIAEWDEIVNHFDVRSEYAKQLGEALAKDLDQKLLIASILSARDTANVTGVPGGSDIDLPSGVTAVTSSGFASGFAEALFAAKQVLVENSVTESAFCVTGPAQYLKLAQETDLYNKDWASAGGDYTQGVIKTVAGIDIVMSNNLPSTDGVTTPTGANNTYAGDFALTAGIVMTKSSVGLLKRKGLTVEKNYDPRRFGTLLTARHCFGAAPLRPETAVEIKFAEA